MQLTYRIWLGAAVLFAGLGCDRFYNGPRPAAAPIAATAAGTGTGAASTGGAAGDVEWVAFYVGSSRAGHGERRRTKQADGTTRVFMKDELAFQRFGDRNEMVAEYNVVEAADGAVQSLACTLTFGPQPQHIDGVVAGNELLVTMHTDKQAPAPPRKLPWSAEIRGPDSVDRSLVAKPLTPGETRTLKRVEAIPGSLVIETVTLKAEYEEDVDLLDGRRKLLRIDGAVDFGIGPPLKALMWTDANGRVLKSAQSLGELTLFTYSTTEEIAKKPDDGLPPDLMLRSMVTLRGPIPGAYDVAELKYRVTLSGDESLADLFPTDPHQRWTPGKERSGELLVRHTSPNDAAGDWKAASDPPTDADRKPSIWIESDDPAVKQLADSAAPAEMKGLPLALTLEKFVRGVIDQHDFTQAMDTAAGVAKRRQGDCTEHAVLLAGLARARGLPARVAVGLVYSERPQIAFYYHMWTEVYVDRWIPLDATMARGGITATHLKLASTGLSDGGALASFLPVARVMGKLAIAVEPLAPAKP